MSKRIMRITNMWALSGLASVVFLLSTLGMTVPAYASGAKAEDAKLIATAWKLAYLDGSDVLDSGFRAYFTLAPSGQIMDGADGCNRITGSYELNGDALRMQVGTITALTCRGNIPDRFRQALERTYHFKIDGLALDLLSRDGVLLASMKTSKPR